MIKAVGKVVVPVDDQEAAKDFWTKCAGFTTTRDEHYGDERWIEVSPPGGGPVLALTLRPSGQTRPEVSEMLPHSPVFFTCDDIEATHEQMRRRGVEFSTPPARMHFGWWALFVDHEGTRYALGQW